MTKNVGSKLRSIRKERGITLQELSSKTGLSLGFLSNLERDLSSPTLDNVHRICNALNISLLRLLESEQHWGSVIRKEERDIAYEQDDKIRYESIRFAEGVMEGFVIVVEPGRGFRRQWAHVYDELGLVLEGEVTIEMGTQEYTLHPGDSFYVRAGTEHSINNRGTTPCSSYWVKLTGGKNFHDFKNIQGI